MDRILKNREVENGIIIPIKIEFNEKNEKLKVTESYIDISYKSMETEARVLSNLYPYKFDYFGFTVHSIESAIQALKYKDKSIREACYEYSGVDAYHLRGMNPYAWQKDGILFTPSGKISRFSEEYQQYLDELYYCAFQNPIYKNNISNSSSKKLDHTIGENNTDYTTLTRTEYISRLYALRYCIENKVNDRNQVIKALTRVRSELK